MYKENEETKEKKKMNIGIIRKIISYVIEKSNVSYDIGIVDINYVLYLIDWKYAIEYNEYLTNISWTYFNGRFEFDNSLKIYLSDDYKCYENDVYLSNNVIIVIEFIIEKLNHMKYHEFKHLVYCTYPVIHQSYVENIDLVKSAIEYDEYKKELEGS